MTDKEILEKALKKVLDNGFTLLELDHLRFSFIILSPSFAKAFWGEELIKTYWTFGEFKQSVPAWKHYLQQMVILSYDEQIKYIERFL